MAMREPAAFDPRGATPGSRARLTPPRIRRTEVDGVPCFWSKVDGPLRAVLTFRVGRCDEELTTGGISHLVEHLSLSTLGRPNYSYNGQVELGFTLFHAAGEPDEIVHFLNTTAEGIADLPLERLSAERRVLQTEAASRKFGLGEYLFGLRYGPAGPGLVGYEEFGLRSLDEDQISEWAAMMFNRSNAVLYLSGPPPEGIELPLAEVDRWEWQEPVMVDQPLPSYVVEDTKDVAFSFVMRRSPAAVMLQGVLQERLIRRLRDELGITYQVGVYGENVGHESVHVIVSTDVLPEHRQESVETVIAVLDDLTERGPTLEELTDLAERYESGLRFPESRLGALHYAARDELLCKPQKSLHEQIADLREIQPGAIANLLDLSLDSSLWILPSGTRIPTWRFQAFQGWSTETVRGKTYRLREGLLQKRIGSGGPPQPKMIVGDDGVTLDNGVTGQLITVRFDRCAGVAAWDNGDRVLYGEDGFRLVIVKDRWRRGDELVRMVDESLSDEHFIPMGAPQSAS